MELTTGYEDRRARIEIVPLIDVVFLLLVFFIYAMLSMTVYRGLRVSLPEGAGAVENVSSVVVSIRADNTLWVDGAPADPGAVVGLVLASRRGAEAPVLISGDRAADLGVAVTLLANLRAAGIERVSFQVKDGP